MKRRAGLLAVVVLVAGCLSGLIFFANDFSKERVLYATSLDGYSIRLVRHPRKDAFEDVYLTGEISAGGRAISGPFWMGSLYSERVEFSEYPYPEDGVVLVYDREMPESVLVGIDVKNDLIWPDHRMESDQMNA